VWKEYRIQRQLWLAVLVLTPVAQLCVVLAHQLSRGTFPDEGYLVIVAGAAAVFMVGCGATLLAAEHGAGYDHSAAGKVKLLHRGFISHFAELFDGALFELAHAFLGDA
jgi:hypothetical protein